MANQSLLGGKVPLSMRLVDQETGAELEDTRPPREPREDRGPRGDRGDRGPRRKREEGSDRHVLQPDGIRLVAVVALTVISLFLVKAPGAIGALLSAQAD